MNLIVALLLVIGLPSWSQAEYLSEQARMHDETRQRIVAQYHLPEYTTDMDRIWLKMLQEPEQHIGEYVLAWVFLAASTDGLAAETPVPQAYPSRWPIRFESLRTKPWPVTGGSECLVQVIGPAKIPMGKGTAKTVHVKEVECLKK